MALKGINPIMPYGYLTALPDNFGIQTAGLEA
jgi:hypothetical protein